MADRKVGVPLMHVFRAAYEARDAKTVSDLRDEAGERVVSTRRSRGRGAITESVLKREVARDLDNLMNTVALGSSIDLEPHPHVARSILNYGIPDIVNISIDSSKVDLIDGDIREALKFFEPRLAADSIVVKRDKTVSTLGLSIRFVIRADLLSDPVNVPVEFVADLEVDSGKIRVGRL